jgi:hypothetical protein
MRHKVTVITLMLLTALSGQPGAAENAQRCVVLPDGVEYRAYLPDNRRFVYVAVKVQPGVFPAVFVIIDKNYDASAGRITAGDPVNQWWTDRSRPMQLSLDKVRVRWREHGTFSFVTDWFTEPDPTEFVQAIRGLEPAAGGRFQGTGASDTNTFAFQARLQMSRFIGDEFDVQVPAVSYDGASVTPPIAHFERQEDNKFLAHC